MSWQRIRGHDALVKMFEQAWQRGRLAHAYLFTGPPGVGKRLFANELAKCLLCENAQTGKLAACDQCPGCIQVEAGTHPDFHAVGRPEDSLELPIETIRELCKSLSFKPARGHGRVAIVDDADDLNDSSANCFLKTLEEPPPQSVLILIGTNPELQLETIVSRCQVVRFLPLSDAVVTDLVREQGVTDPAILSRIVRLGAGSPGQAQALAEQVLWDFRRDFLKGLAQPKPDIVALSQQWLHFIEDAGKESGAQRRRASLVLRLLIDFLNDALRASVGGQPQSREELSSLQDLARRVGTERLLDIIERCLEGDRHIDRRVQLTLALEGLLDAVGRQLSA